MSEKLNRDTKLLGCLSILIYNVQEKVLRILSSFLKCVSVSFKSLDIDMDSTKPLHLVLGFLFNTAG